MKKKCYFYTRVSTAAQIEGYSLEAQQETLRQYAEYREWEVAGEYCDAGKSGKSIKGRPAFQRMLDDIVDQKDNISFVLVFKLSRFGRNAADVLNSLQYIQDFGVNLICVEDGIDSSKDSGKLTITVLSAVAEIERENILVQTMEGRKQKAREGKWNGGQAPCGYRVDPKNSTLVIEPDEAEIVKIIYDKFAHTDMGFVGISDYLNKHGYTKSKYRDQELSHFSRGLIKNVLDNPVYTGKITYGRVKNERVKGKRDEYRRIKTDDYMIADGKHEPIIDEQLWQEVREKRKVTGIKSDKTHSLDHEHLLSGIVKCPICGTGLSGTVRRRRNKKSGDYVDNFYYRCQHRKKVDDEHFCAYKPSLDQNELNHEVELLIMDMVTLDGFNDFIFKRMNEKVDVGALEKEREQLRRQLAQVSGAKTKLNQMLDRLDVTDRHYDRKYQDMQERLNNLYDQIGEIDDSIADINEKINRVYEEQITAKQLCQILTHFDKVYFKMSDLEKKEFLRNLIESIELYPEKQDNGRIIKRVEFKFPVFYEGAEKGGIRLLNENTVEISTVSGNSVTSSVAPREGSVG